mmetsp:Transcript_50519/g.117946  ORF Transcript_50519/g.117946 Transcript_50519/m.117946 type:complete len:309 (-) Transcript_50519:191-1117(-)
MDSQSSETVTFDVGGDKYKVLEQTIRAKPDTLLCTLLDDLGRTDKSQPIFVDGNPKRFSYILDWYRYGSICIPRSLGMEEMRRECAYFQLPDTLKISRERASLEEAVECLQEVRKKARSDAHNAKLAAQEPQVTALVAAVFSEIVGSQELTSNGLGDIQPTKGVLRQLETIAFQLETNKMLELLIAKAAQFDWALSKQERTHLKKFVKKLIDINKQNLDNQARCRALDEVPVRFLPGNRLPPPPSLLFGGGPPPLSRDRPGLPGRGAVPLGRVRPFSATAAAAVAGARVARLAPTSTDASSTVAAPSA